MPDEILSPLPRALGLLAILGAVALLTLLLSGCYVTSQGFRYLGLVAGARSAERLLKEGSASEEERLLLERAASIKAFAVNELGLSETRNFRSLARIKGDSLASVVQACAALSFKRHLWSYPFVGKLPYRGYFDPEDARKEAARLEAQGLDTLVRSVDAFSTLGFLPDPLWSFMSAYSEGELAELIIHEMCHATAFRRGAEAWNEEIATFIGRAGSLAYVASREGQDSAAYRERVTARADSAALAGYLRDTASELEIVYRSAAGDEEKRAAKAPILAARAAAFTATYDSLFATRRFASFPMAKLNNAWLDLYRLYEGEETLYEDYFERVSGSNLPAFIDSLKILAKGRMEPKAAMREALASRKD